MFKETKECAGPWINLTAGVKTTTEKLDVLGLSPLTAAIVNRYVMNAIVMKNAQIEVTEDGIGALHTGVVELNLEAD